MSVLSQLSNEERNLLLLYHRGGVDACVTSLAMRREDVRPRLRAVKARLERLAAAERARAAAAAARLELRP